MIFPHLKIALIISFFAFFAFPAMACVMEDLGVCETITEMEWDTTENIYKFCDGTRFISMRGTGTDGACTDTGALEYDSGNNRYEYCNGVNWVPLGQNGTDGLCTNDGERDYDTTDNVMQYCNGTNVINALSATSVVSQTENLVGHWAFEDGSGITATDRAGSNNGTLTNMDGATDWVTGQIGEGLIFDGGSEYVDIGNVDLVGGQSAFSLAAWVKITDESSNRAVIGRYDSGNAEFLIYYASASDTWAALVLGASGGSTTTSGTVTATADKWTHLVLTYDSSNGSQLYVDGNAVGTPGVARGNVFDSSEDFRIGSTTWAIFPDFVGEIDDVRIYHEELSAAEVEQLYLATDGNPDLGTTCADGITHGESDLITHWTLDDGTGSGTAADSGTTSNTGTLSNMDSATDWITGIDGDALDFDRSSSQQVTTANTTRDYEFRLTDGTIALWLYPTTDTGMTALSFGKGGWEGWTLGYNASDNRPAWSLSDNTGPNDNTCTFATNSLPLSTWTHVAVVIDQTNSEYRCYVNGQFVDDAVITEVITLNNDIHIGSRSNNAYWDGRIDDVRLYERDLTADEIEALYLGTGGT